MGPHSGPSLLAPPAPLPRPILGTGSTGAILPDLSWDCRLSIPDSEFETGSSKSETRNSPTDPSRSQLTLHNSPLSSQSSVDNRQSSIERFLALAPSLVDVVFPKTSLRDELDEIDHAIVSLLDELVRKRSGGTLYLEILGNEDGELLHPIFSHGFVMPSRMTHVNTGGQAQAEGIAVDKIWNRLARYQSICRPVALGTAVTRCPPAQTRAGAANAHRSYLGWRNVRRRSAHWGRVAEFGQAAARPRGVR